MLTKPLQTLPLKNMKIEDLFWTKYISLVEDVILPYQWDIMNDQVKGAEKSYCLYNFKAAAGVESGGHKGAPFQDTDAAKWLEAVAYSLAKKPNSKLEKLADTAVDLIIRAQQKDGYINTYFTLTAPEKRWSNLFEGHELYTAGHLIEAAVAYYQATGKRALLDAMCHFADYICTIFGNGNGQIPGYPGHPEIELALVKLYRVTGEVRYLELSKFFIDQRGVKPQYFYQEECFRTKNFLFPEFKDFGMDYCQAHIPCREQNTAEGHAVRAVYLYSAMADLAIEYQDSSLWEACQQLYSNIVEKRMYITGSIGSAAYGERFTNDYDLPNDTNYSETCATIGLAMFAYRMFLATGDGKYVDTVERAIYNTLLAGIGLDGKHFFYVNPLEVVPSIVEHNPTMQHIKTERQRWFGVACCPPNIARTLASLGQYIYAKNDTQLFVNLYVESVTNCSFNGMKVMLKQDSSFPYSGIIRIAVTAEQETPFTLSLRIPSYSKQFILKINHEHIELVPENGYISITRKWGKSDHIELSLDLSPRFIQSNPLVRANIGKTALVKGPLVYCLEECDNGSNLHTVLVDPYTDIKEHWDDSLLGGVLTLQFDGEILDLDAYPSALYQDVQAKHNKQIQLKAIPYCMWNNRGKGEMYVWLHRK